MDWTGIYENLRKKKTKMKKIDVYLSLYKWNPTVAYASRANSRSFVFGTLTPDKRVTLVPEQELAC